MTENGKRSFMSKKSQKRTRAVDHVQEPEPPARGGLRPRGRSRRSFLRKLWVGLGILAGAEFVGVVFAFLRPRKPPVRETDFGGIIEAGPIDDFEPDSVTAFIRGQFYLSRLKDGGFLALSRKCTHLGCTVPWDSEGNIFPCPCHSSAFDRTGEVISPPAPRALDLHPVDIENGIVRVDTGKKIKRKSFKISQVVRP
jgi:cytochrome b6-f complex iron-sulfur subunit